MALLPWQVESSTIIADHPFIRVRTDRCLTSDGVIVDPFYVLEYRDWCCVMALTVDHEVVLIDEYRHGSTEILRGFPGGVIDQGEDPMVAVRRELAEETGYQCGEIIQVAAPWANPANQPNRCYHFLAFDAVPSGLGLKLDENEEIEVLTAPLSDVRTPGYLTHSMHLALLWSAEHELRRRGLLGAD